mmetsp:Transcript_977/g.3908  ORF Transcript_977/g.3908 Transcript_977/m.3908 type:complete len:119 (+) Transcript_977:117-473(+)
MGAVLASATQKNGAAILGRRTTTTRHGGTGVRPTPRGERADDVGGGVEESGSQAQERRIVRRRRPTDATRGAPHALEGLFTSTSRRASNTVDTTRRSRGRSGGDPAGRRRRSSWPLDI